MELLKSEPSIRPLHDWSKRLAVKRDALVPFFDPGDAGIGARVLFLLEAPGPMTNVGNRRPGSGFISVDNNDRTAENLWTHRKQAGLDESVALLWNIVPWYIGVEGKETRKPNRHELKDGAAGLRELLGMLPNLRVIITCGRFAQKGWKKHLADLQERCTVIETWHPSPLALNRPSRHAEFQNALQRARVAAGPPS